MNDIEIKHRIADLMEDVQMAAALGDKTPFDDGYIDNVNERIGEIETALVALKHELTKHNLNDW